MSFASATFLHFYAVVFVSAWLLARWPAARKLLLLVASYYFYMSWNAELALLIAGSTLVDYGVGLALARANRPGARRAALGISLAANLGLLGFFKYAGFFVASAEALLQRAGFPVHPLELHIILPVGISFYTFQKLSYSIDVYRGRLAPTRSLLDFSLFVAFFPQLVAGPIVRASELLPQIARRVAVTRADVLEGWRRMGVGLAKKIVLADGFAMVADPVFADPGAFGWVQCGFGLLAFTAQIYCDFSAYSDIAIGAARTLGYRLPENFRHPYLARDAREFWRRWHITLSTWLRDYLYVPLGGNRRGRAATYRNLLLTMLLGGLWHGAAWTFVAWGLLHGALLVAQRWRDERRGAEAGTGGAVGMLPTFLFVSLGWVLFRAESFGDAWIFFEGLAGLRGFSAGPPLRTPVLWLLAFLAAEHAVAAVRERRGAVEIPLWLRTAAATVCIGLILAFARRSPEDFIYFQF